MDELSQLRTIAKQKRDATIAYAKREYAEALGAAKGHRLALPGVARTKSGFVAKGDSGCVKRSTDDND